MKLAFLTNILTPYRMKFYDKLYEKCIEEQHEMCVFTMTDSLPLRPWTYNDLRTEYTCLLSGRRIDIGDNDYLDNPRCVKDILKFRPDVLVVCGSWTYPTLWRIVLSKKIRSTCKLLFWTESHDNTGIKNKSKGSLLVSRIKKQVLSRFDGYCVPGEYAYHTVAKYVETRTKEVITLPNLVDNQFYAHANQLRQNKVKIRECEGINNSALVFFTPARLISLKGLAPFFTNVASALKGKNVQFVIAGEGPLKDELLSIADSYEIKLRLIGYQDAESIRKWEAMADVFLLPSLSDANPLTTIEAAWAGLPLCVSCYVGNNPELVEDGKNGVVFDTLNKQSVIDKISFILSQENNWFQKASVLSYHKAKASFDLEIEAVKWLRKVEGLLEGGDKE